MIPSAKEARNQTLENIKNRTTLEKISEKISNAIQNGEFFIVFDRLSYDAQKQLAYLGYTIDPGLQYNEKYYKIERYYKISWERAVWF